jgi:hypothetical protein
MNILFRAYILITGQIYDFFFRKTNLKNVLLWSLTLFLNKNPKLTIIFYSIYII